MESRYYKHKGPLLEMKKLTLLPSMEITFKSSNIRKQNPER